MDVITLKTSRDYYSIKEAANDSMTIGELIDELQGYNRGCKIVFSNDNGYTYGVISTWDIESEEVKSDEEERMEEIEDEIESLKLEIEDIEEERDIDLADIESDDELSDAEYAEEKANILGRYEKGIESVKQDIEKLQEEYDRLAQSLNN